MGWPNGWYHILCLYLCLWWFFVYVCSATNQCYSTLYITYAFINLWVYKLALYKYKYLAEISALLWYHSCMFVIVQIRRLIMGACTWVSFSCQTYTQMYVTWEDCLYLYNHTLKPFWNAVNKLEQLVPLITWQTST